MVQSLSYIIKFINKEKNIFSEKIATKCSFFIRIEKEVYIEERSSKILKILKNVS